MRIRKHAKISPLVYAAASLRPGAVLQPHVCQLNRSPWDVMEFSPPSTPPPPGQADADAVPAGNGSFERRFSAGKSTYTGQPPEHPNNLPANTAATVNSAEPPPPPPPSEESDPAKITICSKTDGKNWKCKREASIGNTMCDHHLSQVRNYSYAHTFPAKNPNLEARRPARRKKPAATSSSSSSASSSNPNEFYYYSGFGPRWAKKRGSTSTGTTTTMTGEERKNSSWDEDSDYGDEEEEEDESGEKKRGKRGRKPIKARSLKSLM